MRPRESPSLEYLMKAKFEQMMPNCLNRGCTFGGAMRMMGISVKHWGSQTSWSLDSTANFMHLLLPCKNIETRLGEY